MKITEHRTKELLCWHDDMAGDHTVLFEAMTAHRDTAALIRQLQAEVQDAWHAGLDAGREQGKDHAQQPAAVDGADRDDARRYRALVATGKYVPAMQGWGLACGSAKASKAELDAAADALTAQPGGSDNDR